MNIDKHVKDELLLIDRARNGEMTAIRDLFELSKLNVYRLAYDLLGNRQDAEDLSQDVFLKAFRSLSAFRGDSKWTTWLYRITVNTCLDFREKRSKMKIAANQQSDGEEMVNEIESAAIPPDSTAGATMIQRDIEKALNLLTPRERSVFVLRHYHDQPLKSIAESLNVTEGTVKTLLFRAVRRLQDELAIYRADVGAERR